MGFLHARSLGPLLSLPFTIPDLCLFLCRFVELLPGETAEGELLTKPREVQNSFWAQARPTPLIPAAQLLAYSEAAAELMVATLWLVRRLLCDVRS